MVAGRQTASTGEEGYSELCAPEVKRGNVPRMKDSELCLRLQRDRAEGTQTLVVSADVGRSAWVMTVIQVLLPVVCV